MDRWIKIDSKQKFEEMRVVINKIKGYHPITNDVNRMIEYTFEEIAGQNIQFAWFSEDFHNANFLKRVNHVWYLIYYISKMESYCVPDFDGEVLCEVFDKDTKSRQNGALELLAANHVVFYTSYHKYVLDLEQYHTEKNAVFDDDTIYFLRGGKERTEEYVFKYFEQESDTLPEREKYESYEAEREKYWILKEHDIAGGCIGKRKDLVFDEEYIFIKSEYRNNRYGLKLLRYIASENKSRGLKRQICWIKDTNSISMRLHINLGFIKQGEKKTVLRREGK